MTRLGRFQPSNLVLVRDAHTQGSIVTTFPTISGIPASDAVVLSYSLPYGGTPRKLIWSHGFDGDITQITSTGSWGAARLWQQVLLLAEGRYILFAVNDGVAIPSLSAANGGNLGNDAGITRTETLVNWAYTQYPGDRVASIGWSAGAMTMANWAYNGNNVDQVATFLSVDGTVAMDYLQSHDPGLAPWGPIAPFLGDAYSPSTWASVAPVRDPASIAAKPAIQAIPWINYDATGDGTLPDAMAPIFGTAYGANYTVHNIGTGNHDTVHDSISVAQVLAHLDAANWANEVFYPQFAPTVPTVAVQRAVNW